MRTIMEKKVELDKLVADFCSWQEVTADIVKENELLNKELKVVHKRNILDQEAAQAKAEEASHLRTVVDKLHRILTKTCDLEEDNRELTNEIKSMKASAVELEKTHSCQMAEALENLRTLTDTHEIKLASVQGAGQLKLKQEVEAKEREIQDKVAEVKLLQREKAELDRMRHTDIVKLRLEYDAKMLKLQKQQNARAQHVAPQPSSTSNDIFRKKLQHVKAESEKETVRLKRRIEDLERQFQTGNRASAAAAKRNRLL